MKIKIEEELSAGKLLKRIVEKRLHGEPHVDGYDQFDRPSKMPISDAQYEDIANEFVRMLKGPKEI